MNHLPPGMYEAPEHGLRLQVVRLQDGWEGIVYDYATRRNVFLVFTRDSPAAAWRDCGHFVASYMNRGVTGLE